MRLIDVNALPASSWKNGSGSTRTIAMFPPDASLDDFDWRVSIAEVASEARFSPFSGVDRIILLLQGAGMMLHVNGAVVPLTTLFAPFAFSGDETVRCRLVNGATQDFNVMTRRGRAQATVTIERLEFRSRADAAIYFCPGGSWRAGHMELHSGWAVHAEKEVTFAPTSPDAVMIVVLINNLET